VQFIIFDAVQMAGGVSASSLLTREIVNVWRVPDFARIGFQMVGLYRHRKHTFPVSDVEGAPSQNEMDARFDEGVYMSTLCRTCFYDLMFQAVMEQPLEDFDTVVLMARSIFAKISARQSRHVAVHTLWWYLLFRQARAAGYPFPIVQYEALVLLPPSEVRAHLFQRLPSGVDAEAMAAELLASRRDPAWLRARETLYMSQLTEAESWVGVLLDVFRRLDPATNISVLA